MSEQNQKSLREMLDSMEASFKGCLEHARLEGHRELLASMRSTFGLPEGWPAPHGWERYFRDLINAGKERDALRSELDQTTVGAKARINQLTTRIGEIAAERNQAFAQVTIKSQEWMDERSKLIAQNRELSRDNDFLRSQEKSLKQMHEADLKRRLDALRGELRYSGESGQALKDAEVRIAELESVLEEQKESEAQGNESFQRMSQTCKEYHAEREQLRAEIKRLADVNQSLRENMEHLRTECDKAIKLRRHHFNEGEMLRAERDGLRVNLDDMRKERDAALATYDANVCMSAPASEVHQVAIILGLEGEPMTSGSLLKAATEMRDDRDFHRRQHDGLATLARLEAAGSAKIQRRLSALIDAICTMSGSINGLRPLPEFPANTETCVLELVRAIKQNLEWKPCKPQAFEARHGLPNAKTFEEVTRAEFERLSATAFSMASLWRMCPYCKTWEGVSDPKDWNLMPCAEAWRTKP